MMSDLHVPGLVILDLCGNSLLRKTEGGQALAEDLIGCCCVQSARHAADLRQ